MYGRAGTTIAHPEPSGAVDAAVRFVVRAAILAPSIHNTQPWRFTTNGDGFELWTDPERRLQVADPSGRELVISCGAALFNARLAVRHLGFVPKVQLLPDPAHPDLLARIAWGTRRPPRPYEEVLYRTIPRRHTSRGPFLATELPPMLPTVLTAIARREHADLRVVADGPKRRQLAQHIRNAETAQRRDPRFADETLRWTAPPNIHRPDGLAAGSYPAQPDGLEFASRDFAPGRPWGFRVRTRARLDGPVLGTVAVLTTREDRRLDWLLAGQALQHLLLHTATAGVSAAFHTQPLESPIPRSAIRRDLNCGHPQMILRLGHPRRTLTTPRRPVMDVITKT